MTNETTFMYNAHMNFRARLANVPTTCHDATSINTPCIPTYELATFPKMWTCQYNEKVSGKLQATVGPFHAAFWSDYIDTAKTMLAGNRAYLEVRPTPRAAPAAAASVAEATDTAHRFRRILLTSRARRTQTPVNPTSGMRFSFTPPSHTHPLRSAVPAVRVVP